MADPFAGSLTSEDIISNIEQLTNEVFNPNTDLLIQDEIGECQRAATSLKYFVDKRRPCMSQSMVLTSGY